MNAANIDKSPDIVIRKKLYHLKMRDYNSKFQENSKNI